MSAVWNGSVTRQAQTSGLSGAQRMLCQHQCTQGGALSREGVADEQAVHGHYQALDGTT